MQGVYAIIEFSGVDSALDVLHYQQPLVLRDVPLTVRPREFKTKITKKANKELDDTCSSGMDKQEEEDSFENDVSELLIENESGFYTEGTWEGPRLSLPFDLLSPPP